MRLLLAEDEKELSSFWSFLVISILISVAGILVVFVLVLVFSKIAVKPFAESYEKQKRFITDASHEIKTPLTIIEANRMQRNFSVKENLLRIRRLPVKLIIFSTSTTIRNL